MPMKILATKPNKIVNLCDHVPIAITGIDGMAQMKDARDWVRKLTTVSLPCPIVAVFNNLVMHMIIPESKQNLQILKRGACRVEPLVRL